LLGYLDQTLHTKKKIRIGHTSQTISPTKENHDVCKANAKPKFKQLDTRNYGDKHGLRLKKIWGFVTTLLPWATLTLITLFLKLLKCAK
jgi:hypothetical protein